MKMHVHLNQILFEKAQVGNDQESWKGLKINATQ